MSATKSNNFIPLKIYSTGSILTSVNKIDKIVDFLKKNGFSSAALVDLENVFLAIDFYKKMKKSGMKAIIGCGFTIEGIKAITLICKNKEGWKNLLKLIYISYKNSNSDPYLKLSDLSKIDGLYCLIGSPYSFSSTEEHKYIDLSLDLQKVFGSNLYIEQHPDFIYISELLDSLLHAKILGCSDCFYFEDHEKLLNNILIANKLKKKIEDIQDHFLVKYNFKYKDISELKDEYLKNTIDFANSISDLELLSEPCLPEFGTEKPIEELKKICIDNLYKLNLGEDHKKRLEHELNVIDDAGFASYFLIVSDMIRFAKSKNMMIGGCRGCLSADNDIYLSNGNTSKINKILVGDSVIGSDGLAHKVTNVFMYHNHDNLYQIKTYYGDKNGIKLTPDHKILTLEGWKRADKISKDDYIFTPKILQSICINDDDYLEEHYIYGLFTGDGWIRKNRPTEVNIIYHTKNIDSLIRTCIYLNSKKLRFSIYFRKSDNTYTLNILSKIAYSCIFNHFPDYAKTRKSEDKHIPELIKTLNSKGIEHFLNGYADADGHNNGKSISYSTKSKRLSREIKFLHHILNKPCGLIKVANRQEYKIVNPLNPQFSIKTDNGIYNKVRDISIIDPEMYVYDIEVENSHDYLTTSGIVHNSVGGSITAYLSEITDIDPLEHGLIFERFYNSSRNYEKHISFGELDYVQYKNENI